MSNLRQKLIGIIEKEVTHEGLNTTRIPWER